MLLVMLRTRRELAELTLELRRVVGFLFLRKQTLLALHVVDEFVEFLLALVGVDVHRTILARLTIGK